MPFEFFPNTNFHDMNLDYILEKTQKIDDNMRDSQASADAAKASEEAAKASEDAAKLSEENAKASEEAAKDYADNIADPVSGIVTDWLEENITQETGYVLDASLRSSAAAAPAFTVGDLCVVGTHNMLTTAARLETFCPTKSIDDFPAQSIAVLGASPATLTLTGDIPVINGSSLGMVITLNFHRTAGPSGMKQVFIGAGGVATRSHGASAWTTWVYYTGDEAMQSWANNQFVGRYSTMILNAETLSTLTGGTNSADDFPVNKIIYFSNAAPDAVNGASFMGNKGGCYLTLSYNGTASSGSMQLFFPRYGGVATRLRTGSGWLDWIYSAVNPPTVYNVGASRDYHTLTELWLDLENDDRQKIVYVDPGTYDVFAEYQAAIAAGKLTPPPDGTTTSNYKPYCVNIPSNTTVIGLGRVTLKWEPQASQISDKESQIWSPVNVHGANVHISNITVTCKNGRYCIHDDTHNAFPGTENSYTNVVCYKKTNDSGKGFSMAQGMGYCDKGIYTFDNCKWFNEITGTTVAYCVGGHEGATGSSAVYENGATVVYKNCVIVSAISNCMRFQTINSTGASQRITVDIDSCYLSGGIWLDQYSAGSGQFYDLTLVNSGNPNFQIDIGASNPFTPKVYNS